MIKEEIVTNEPTPYSLKAKLLIEEVLRKQRCFREQEDTPVNVDFLMEQIYEAYLSIEKIEYNRIYTDSKNGYTAEKFRRRAKTLFSQKLYQEAAKLYNKAVSHAPNGSEELGLAYCGRSEVLFAQQLYYECLLDTNRAIQCELSENSEEEIRKRKESCLTHLEGVENVMQNPNATEPFENYTNNIQVRDVYGLDIVEVEFGKTSVGAPRVGLIARRDVNTGERMRRESLSAIALDPLYQFTRCDFCLRAYPALIPCSTCTWVLYCTKVCRARASSVYHWVECKVIKLYGKRTRDTLALRIFLAGTEQGQQLHALQQHIDPRQIFHLAPPIKTKNNCVKYYPLTLWNSRKFSKDMLYSKATRPDILSVVVRTIIALRNVKFFDTDLTVQSENHYEDSKEMFAALLLMNNVISLEQEDFRIIIGEPLDKDRQRIGFAVYLYQSFSFDAHESNTKAITKHGTRRRYYYATRPIKAGEEINCSYTQYQEEDENDENLISSQPKD